MFLKKKTTKLIKYREITNFFLKKKKLFLGYKNNSGRNNFGKITVNHKGGKQKNLNILLDTKKLWSYKYATIIATLKTIKRNTNIGLIKYTNGCYSYILIANGCNVGSVIFSMTLIDSFFFRPNLGCVICVKFLKKFSIFFNLNTSTKRKSQYAKAAGVFCQLIETNLLKNNAVIKLPSSINKIITLNCFVTIGRNSNTVFKYLKVGKAGENRKKGIKPTVRGVAKNPVDHPHGGRTKTNSPEKSPWGWIAKKNK